MAPLTFDAARPEWLRERDVKPWTREGYEHLLRRGLAPALGPLTIDSITPSVVRIWWSHLPADKPTVRARSDALLKAVMNTAVADEVLDSNRVVSGARRARLEPGRSARPPSMSSR